MYLFSCVFVAFSLSRHLPISRFHLHLAAFSCALVSRAFPAPAPLAAPLIYPLSYRSFSYTFASAVCDRAVVVRRRPASSVQRRARIAPLHHITSYYTQ
jgi:hypothetical protein